jgi:hypothetical protein
VTSELAAPTKARRGLLQTRKGLGAGAETPKTDKGLESPHRPVWSDSA